MGAGASAAADASKGLSAAHAGQEGHGGGTTTHLDVVEGGVQWLASAVESEKREKEWLAKVFDASCEEVQALQQEIAHLRQELVEARRDGLPAVGVSAPSLSISSRETNPQDSASPVDSPKGGGLMGRRGLRLGSLDTAQRSSLQRSSQQPATPISPVQEEKTPVRIPAPVIEEVQKQQSLPAEPMSALLKRRENWALAGGTPSVIQPRTLRKANTQQNLQLGPQVASQKVFSMVEEREGECPVSPKRAGRRRSGVVDRSRFQTCPGGGTAGLAAGLTAAGSGGTLDN